MNILVSEMQATQTQRVALEPLFQAAHEDNMEQLNDPEDQRGMVFGQVSSGGSMKFAYVPYPYSKRLVEIVEEMEKA